MHKQILSITIALIALLGANLGVAFPVTYTVELFPKDDPNYSHFTMTWNPGTKEDIETATIKYLENKNDKNSKIALGITQKRFKLKKEDSHQLNFIRQEMGSSLFTMHTFLNEDKSIKSIKATLTTKTSKRPKSIKLNPDIARQTAELSLLILSKMQEYSKETKNKIIPLHKKDADLRDQILEQLKKPLDEYKG